MPVSVLQGLLALVDVETISNIVDLCPRDIICIVGYNSPDIMWCPEENSDCMYQYNMNSAQFIYDNFYSLTMSQFLKGTF